MLTTGIKGKETVTAAESNSAKTMGSGSLDVFATPAMVALMEKTAVKSVESHLEPGQTTVGTALDIKDGRKLTFAVTASDERGVIGSGMHERFIVDAERFQEKTNNK